MQIQRRQLPELERTIQEKFYALAQKIDPGWHILTTHGNIYQQGLPDALFCHAIHGIKWVEFKRPSGFSFTGAQKIWFPILAAAGAKIYVISGYERADYQLLFADPNWATKMYFSKK